MNAEFTEKKIVITDVTTGEGTVTTISPATIRKGLHAGSFVGAEVYVITNGVLVYAGIIDSAIFTGSKVLLNRAGSGGNTIITYDPATGELAIGPVNNGSGQTTEPETP